jgi:hypothetical protein
MTLTVKQRGDLDEDADMLVDVLMSKLVRDLREAYGQTVPTDDRLADVENTLRNFIWDHVPKARHP